MRLSVALAAAGAVWLAWASLAGADSRPEPELRPFAEQLVLAAHPPLSDSSSGRDCIPPQQCCKVCSKGKACGNSCISRSYTCRKARGCACDAGEVCR